MDGNVFLNDLLSFLDEALLECLDLEEELKGVGVSALKLPPSVVVERVLQLFRQSLDLEALLLQSVSQAKDFLLVLGNLAGLRLLDLELAFVLADLVAEEFNVLEALVVLHLTLGESDLQDLDLLVEESKLIISTDQLCAEDITLSHERS